MPGAALNVLITECSLTFDWINQFPGRFALIAVKNRSWGVWTVFLHAKITKIVTLKRILALGAVAAANGILIKLLFILNDFCSR